MTLLKVAKYYRNSFQKENKRIMEDKKEKKKVNTKAQQTTHNTTYRTKKKR